MRIVMNQYAEGDKFAVETATDGSVVVRDLLGRRRPGARISAYTEVACDDTEKGLERLQESLAFLTDEVRKRLDEVRKRQEHPANV
jgi:hypothetical protein